MIKAALKNATLKSALLLLVFSMFQLVVMPAKPALAASTIADSPCDSLYYETLSSRAWLEAQREITQNQNFILKPDSVFQYTCFDRFVNELAQHAQNMLTETNAYGSPLGSTSMDGALNNLVIGSLIQYVGQNFATTNLLANHSAAAGILSPTPATVSGSGAYSCNVMGRVWNAAKCTNFISYPAYDGFYTFQEYITGPDPRHLPTSCEAPASPTLASAVAAKAAYASNLAYALTSGPWSNDPVETFFALTGPQSFGPTCSGNCPCTGAPIETGIQVFRSGSATPNTYSEKICLQAGCRYNPPGGELYVGSGPIAEGCYAR